MVRFLLRTSTPYSVLDAASNLQKLDIGYWRALVSNDVPGLDVIAAPADLLSKHQLGPDQMLHVLSFVRSYYDWSILDLGRGLGRLTMSLLDEIDELFLVTNSEVPALHLARKMVATLLANSYQESRIRLVANRSERITESASRELESLLGLPLYANLPSDYARLFRSYSEGKLLTRGGRLEAEFALLARRMIGAPEGKKPKEGAGEWLGGLSWFGRKATG
jgi:pilus assembly protein CpaE